MEAERGDQVGGRSRGRLWGVESGASSRCGLSPATARPSASRGRLVVRSGFPLAASPGSRGWLCGAFRGDKAGGSQPRSGGPSRRPGGEGWTGAGLGEEAGTTRGALLGEEAGTRRGALAPIRHAPQSGQSLHGGRNGVEAPQAAHPAVSWQAGTGLMVDANLLAALRPDLHPPRRRRRSRSRQRGGSSRRRTYCSRWLPP